MTEQKNIADDISRRFLEKGKKLSLVGTLRGFPFIYSQGISASRKLLH
jgi:hypothetical protein